MAIHGLLSSSLSQNWDGKIQTWNYHPTRTLKTDFHLVPTTYIPSPCAVHNYFEQPRASGNTIRCFIHISSCGSITDDSRVPQSQLCANAPQSIHNYLALPYLPLIFHSIPLIYPTTSPWMPPSMSINVAKPNHQRPIPKNAFIIHHLFTITIDYRTNPNLWCFNVPRFYPASPPPAAPSASRWPPDRAARWPSSAAAAGPRPAVSRRPPAVMRGAQKSWENDHL